MASAMQHTRPNDPDAHYKMPGYTGYIHGLQETFGKTPTMAQLDTREPPPPTNLFARTAAPVISITDAKRDACNNPSVYLPAPASANLWPGLQSTGRQESVKARTSNISLGDNRIPTFATSYGRDFSAPFNSTIRSPLLNKELMKVSDLRHIYTSAYNRVGRERLDHIMVLLSENLFGKMGNANNNAFKLRKLFRMYDTDGSGKIQIEDFRVMTEQVGVQLDDDSLLALFSQHDPSATGFLDYNQLMKLLLDEGSFKLYSAGGPQSVSHKS